MNYYIIIFLAIAMTIMLILYTPNEHFWGGYFPVPYMNQYVQQYGRTGVNAATDQPPQLLINRCAKNINQ